MVGEELFIASDFQERWEGDAVVYSVKLSDCAGNSKYLRYEVYGLPKSSLAQSADAFFAPILLYSMKHNADVYFDIPISESIAYSSGDLAYVFGVQLKLIRRTAVRFKNIVSVRRQSSGTVTGFSSGVDSWFSIKTHLLDAMTSSKRITHLLVNDVGANGTVQKIRDVAHRAEQVANHYGLGLIRVSSNMGEFLQMDFQRTHTARNASIAHLLMPIADTFLYSSADTYVNCGVFPTYDMAHGDVVILPLLSNDAMALKSSGSAFSRAEKTREILSIPLIEEKLDVCVNHEHGGSKINCGFCWKCMRTELTLEAFGCLKNFNTVFDLDAYYASRRKYIQTISISNKPTEREAFKIARASKLIGPVMFYQPIGLARRAVNFARRVLRFIRKSIAHF